MQRLDKQTTGQFKHNAQQANSSSVQGDEGSHMTAFGHRMS
jgi:hypothetical protein